MHRMLNNEGWRSASIPERRSTLMGRDAGQGRRQGTHLGSGRPKGRGASGELQGHGQGQGTPHRPGANLNQFNCKFSSQK